MVMMKWMQDVFTLVVGEAGGKILRDLIRGELKEGAGVIAERVRVLVKENPRADLLYVLLALDPPQAATLWQRYRAVKGTAAENAFVVTIAQAIPRKADQTLDLERAKAVYGAIAEMDPAAFDDVVEMLRHDPIAQQVRSFLEKGQDFGEAVLHAAAYAAGRLDGRAEADLPAREQRIRDLQATIAGKLAARRERGW